MTYNVYSGTLIPTHFTSLQLLLSFCHVYPNVGVCLVCRRELTVNDAILAPRLQALKILEARVSEIT